MTAAYEYKKQLDFAIESTLAHKLEFLKGSKNFSRKRKLPLETVVKMLHTMSGGSLNKELYNLGVEATPSAFVQQRAKLSPEFFRSIMLSFNHACTDSNTYRGYRLLAIDGSCINMARNPNSESFVSYEGNPKGYNQLHLNALYDLCNFTYYDATLQFQPQSDEIGALIRMLYQNDFVGKNLIIADRGYESYNLFAHLLNHGGVDFLIRVKQNKSAMREIAKLPLTELDTYVEFTITNTQTKEDKEKGYILLQKPKKPSKNSNAKTRQGRWDFPSPYTMKFRVVRFMLETLEYETVVTSLPMSFTSADIKKLYAMRWGIETSFKMLKFCMGLVNLHGKSDDFVKQEIYTALTMFNFCNRISNAVAISQKETNIYEYKVNLTMAIYLCKEFYKTPNADGEKLMRDIARYTEPIRLGRKDERNIKAKSFVGFTYRVSA